MGGTGALVSGEHNLPPQTQSFVFSSSSSSSCTAASFIHKLLFSHLSHKHAKHLQRNDSSVFPVSFLSRNILLTGKTTSQTREITPSINNNNDACERTST